MLCYGSINALLCYAMLAMQIQCNRNRNRNRNLSLEYRNTFCLYNMSYVNFTLSALLSEWATYDVRVHGMDADRSAA